MDGAIEKLFRTNPIKGNFCHLYHVESEDSEFILRLRKSREQYIKKIDGDIETQNKYLKNYLKRFNNKEEIYYKMYDPMKKTFCGVTRFTNLNKKEYFGFESGVMDIQSSPNIYLDAMFMIYRIGFEFLKRKYSGPWMVDKKNKRMISLHKVINIGKIDSFDDNYVIFYAYREDYQNNINVFLKKNFGEIQDLYK